MKREIHPVSDIHVTRTGHLRSARRSVFVIPPELRNDLPGIGVVIFTLASMIMGGAIILFLLLTTASYATSWGFRCNAAAFLLALLLFITPCRGTLSATGSAGIACYYLYQMGVILG